MNKIKYLPIYLILIWFMGMGIAQAQLVLSSSNGLADSAWPMLMGNVRHTGLSKYDTSGVDGTVKWTFEAGEGIESSPVIGADGTIYFGAHDNKFYAVNSDGTLKWKFNAGEPIYSAEWNVYKGITSTAAIDKNGTIYFVSMSNWLFALNPDGSEKWRYAVHDFVNAWLAPVIGQDGTIYVGSEKYPAGQTTQQEIGGNFYAINPEGTLKWKYQSNAAGFGNYAAIGADGTIYAAGGDWEESQQNFVSKLLAFNPDGSIKWKFKPDSVIEGSPTIADDGSIYFGTKNGKFFALNSDGSQKWVFPTGGGISAVAALGQDQTIYIGSWDGNFYALNPDGSEKWRFDVKIGRDPKVFEDYPGKETISSSAAISHDGTIYFGDIIDTFYALDLNGQEKWRYQGGSFGPSPAIGSDGTVYVTSYNKKLYAFGKKESVATTATETSKTTVEKEGKKAEPSPTAESSQTSTQTLSPTPTTTPANLQDEQLITKAVFIWSTASILLLCLFWAYSNQKWLFRKHD